MSSTSTPRNRRMTLSTLPTPSERNANRRKSVDPASAAPGIPKSMRRPPKGRVSMIPRVGGRENNIPPGTPSGGSGTATATATSAGSTASSRRRSIGGDSFANNHNNRRQSLAPLPPSSSSVGQRADPRLINDKNFQHQCIRELLSFLQERGYEYPVSSKSLTRPSAKDFTNIATFLLRQLDKDFQRGGMKFEDEVALIFKCMGYPFPISKTALVAAGSPHTWPTLLAALSWLVHQLDCKSVDVDRNELDNETSTPFESLQDLETQTDKAFFQYMVQAYVAFMQGDAVATERLELAFLQRFERDDAFLEQAVERVTDLNASIVERINETSQISRDIQTLTMKRDEYANAIDEFHTILLAYDKETKKHNQEVEERTTKIAEMNGKIDKVTTNNHELNQRIKEQEFSVDDLPKMNSELNGLSEASDRAGAIRDQRRKMLLASQEELVTVCNDLDSMTADYNGKILELQLVPENGSKFDKVKAGVKKDKLLDSDQSQMLGVDLRGHVQQIVFSSKQAFLDKVDRAKTQYQDLLDQMNYADDACEQADAKLKIIEDKKLKCELTLESERKAHTGKHAVREREVDAMEAKIASMQDPVALEEEMAAFERQCAELEALRIEHQEENIAKYRAVLSEVNSACQLMADHDAYVRQRAAEVKAYWRQRIDQLGGIVAPTNIKFGDK